MVTGMSCARCPWLLLSGLLILAGCASHRAASPVVPAAAPAPAPATPDPVRAWKEELLRPETRTAALERLHAMALQDLRPLVPMLSDLSRGRLNEDLFQEGGPLRPRILQTIARLKDPATIPLFIEALAYDEDRFEHAVVAADFLAEMKAAEAVEPLVHAMEHRLPIKSRANRARLAAMQALVTLGDARAVPGLIRVLTTSADEQDFLLNQKAALALSRLPDQRAIPALIDGLYMTGRGARIFQESRLGLVNIGPAAVPALMALLDPSSAASTALAQRLKMEGGDLAQLPKRAAIVLSDLGAFDAVPALVAAYRRAPVRDNTPKPPADTPAFRAWAARQIPAHEHAAILMALGLMGGRQATDALVTVLKDKKDAVFDRTAAAEALSWTGDDRVVPALLAAAASGQASEGDEPDLRVYAISAAVHLAPSRDRSVRKVLTQLMKRAPDSVGLKRAQDGRDVIERCAGDPVCLAKALGDPSLGAIKAAVFALGQAEDDQAALAILAQAIPPICKIAASSFDPMLTILFWIRRLGDKSATDTLATLDELIDNATSCAFTPAAHDLLGEARVTAAILRHRDRAKP
jgi:HEAT repeat protein